MDTAACDVALPHPLSELVSSCASFCQVDCCELNAFDVNAYAMLWWAREHPDQTKAVREQLEALIAEVAKLRGSVRIEDYCHEWSDGAACAQYLRMWHAEYCRALSIGPDGTPPAQRLREAAERGRSEYVGEVYRMSYEGVAAEGATPVSDVARKRALSVLTALARLDPNDPGVKQEVAYAQRVLSAQGRSWEDEA